MERGRISHLESHLYKPEYTNSWALIIGINKYLHASPLGFATNDAEAMAQTLESRFGFPKDNIQLLLDDKATIGAIRSAFLSYADDGRIGTDDRLLVFFAGHGHTVTGRRGEVGFLVPVDGEPNDLNTLIRWDELTRNADLIPAKHVFFIMDACYGGLALLRSPAFGSMRFLGDMLRRNARQVLTAGKADETVADGNGVRPGHSIFTAHLLDALEGRAATEEGVITASGVMAYVYDRVGRDQYSHQTPHYGFIDGDGDFVFDTSVLDKLRAKDGTAGGTGKRSEGTAGEADILVNTSQQLAGTIDTEPALVDRTKELLAVPANRIKLDDLVTREVKRLLASIDLRHFPAQGTQPTKEEFEKRLQEYDASTVDLIEIAVLLAKWASDDQLPSLEAIFVRLAEADKGSDGYTLWINFAWYPVSLLMYAAGISALAAQRYDVLKIILGTPVRTPRYEERGNVPVVVPVFSGVSQTHDAFKWLPGHERHFVPRSEYVFKKMQPQLEDLLFLARSYEDLFDRFEMFVALTFADQSERGWGPPGRFSWKQSRGWGEGPLDALIKEAQSAGENWPPLRAGLFGGSLDRFLKVAEVLKAQTSRLGWF